MMLYFVRHGQTDWNVLQKVQGQADIPLNEVGIAQAKEVAKSLSMVAFDKVFCSPLMRAKQTCQQIFQGEILYDDRLLERNFGVLEGLTAKQFDLVGFWNENCHTQYQNAESLHDFKMRVFDFLQEITQKYKSKNILVVCHGGVGMVLRSYFEGNPPNGNYFAYLAENAKALTYEI